MAEVTTQASYLYYIVYSNVYGQAFWEFGVLEDVLRSFSPGFVERCQRARNISWSHDSFDLAKQLGEWLTEAVRNGAVLPANQASKPTITSRNDRVMMMIVQVSDDSDGAYVIVWPESIITEKIIDITRQARNLFDSLRTFGPMPIATLQSIVQMAGERPEHKRAIECYREDLALLHREISLGLGFPYGLNKHFLSDLAIDVADGKPGEGIW